MDLQPLHQVEVSKAMKTARTELGGGHTHLEKGTNRLYFLQRYTGSIGRAAQVQLADPQINTKVKDARSMLTAR